MADPFSAPPGRDTFASWLRTYRALGGRFLSGVDCLAMGLGLVMGGLLAPPSAALRLAPAVLPAAALSLGVVLLDAMGVPATAPRAVRRALRAVGGWPALLVPYGLTGAAWAVTLGSAAAVLILPATPLADRTGLLVLVPSLALSTTWTVSLFGSVGRWTSLIADCAPRLHRPRPSRKES